MAVKSACLGPLKANLKPILWQLLRRHSVFCSLPDSNRQMEVFETSVSTISPSERYCTAHLYRGEFKGPLKFGMFLSPAKAPSWQQTADTLVQIQSILRRSTSSPLVYDRFSPSVSRDEGIDTFSTWRSGCTSSSSSRTLSKRQTPM